MDPFVIDVESLTQDHWSSSELANFSTVMDFVQTLMNRHDFDDVLSRFGNNRYVQHNQGLPDGISGLVEFLRNFTSRYPEYCYDVKRAYVDNDHVIFHTHCTLRKKHRGNPKKGMQIIDTWRIQDGDIVEHWDAIQPLEGFLRFYTLLTGGAVRNSNSLF